MAKWNIVVLANSIKHHAHCVAGKCVTTKEWIRPVSNANGAELTHEQAKCKNPHGKFKVKPKQKIEIGVSQHAPLINQPENYIVDNSIWQQRYRIEDNELHHYLDTPEDIWGPGDRVLFSDIQNGTIVVTQSLYLVQVQNLNLHKNQFDKRRASFHYSGKDYDLAVTDPRFDAITTKNEPIIGVVCISLGGEFEGSCYKIVATVF